MQCDEHLHSITEYEKWMLNADLCINDDKNHYTLILNIYQDVSNFLFHWRPFIYLSQSIFYCSVMPCMEYHYCSHRISPQCSLSVFLIYRGLVLIRYLISFSQVTVNLLHIHHTPQTGLVTAVRLFTVCFTS